MTGDYVASSSPSPPSSGGCDKLSPDSSDALGLALRVQHRVDLGVSLPMHIGRRYNLSNKKACTRDHCYNGLEQCLDAKEFFQFRKEDIEEKNRRKKNSPSDHPTLTT